MIKIFYQGEVIHVPYNDDRLTELGIKIVCDDIGENVFLGSGVCIYGASSIGSDVFIGANSYIGPGVVIGSGTNIEEKCFIGEMADVGMRCSITKGARIFSRVLVGEGTFIGQWCLIGAGVIIGSKCFIGSDCFVGDKCYINKNTILLPDSCINVLYSKYTCHRVNDLIKIGCESHFVEDWRDKAFQEDLGSMLDKDWWEETGRRILNFLLGD